MEDGERIVIDAIVAGEAEVDCWVWDSYKRNGFRAKVFAFGNSSTSKGRLFYARKYSEGYYHAEPYEEQDKRKSVYKPWTKETFPLKVGSVVKDKGADFQVIICALKLSTEQVWLGYGACATTFDELFDKWNLLDGSPCGQEMK
jgi:hypothetical protein